MFMRMASGNNRTFAVCLAQWCEIVYIQYEYRRYFAIFLLEKNRFLELEEDGTRSELDFAVRDCRKRGSKSYFILCIRKETDNFCMQVPVIYVSTNMYYTYR